MREPEIVAMGEQDRFYWWHVCRRYVWQAILDKWLPDSRHSGKSSRTHPESYDLYDPGQARMTGNRQILDVGCGGGFNLEFLKRWGDVVGIDQSEAALASAKQYGAVEKGDALNLPRSEASVDLVTAFDVLEHISDDESALKGWNRVLKIGGYVAISVPAYQWLYGPHDKALLHQRRYALAELSGKLTRARFQPIFSSYVFMFTFPVFLVQRLLTKGLKQGAGYNSAPPIINQILIGLGKIEAMLVRFVSLPFGSSVFILARKP